MNITTLLKKIRKAFCRVLMLGQKKRKKIEKRGGEGQEKTQENTADISVT